MDDLKTRLIRTLKGIKDKANSIADEDDVMISTKYILSIIEKEDKEIKFEEFVEKQKSYCGFDRYNAKECYEYIIKDNTNIDFAAVQTEEMRNFVVVNLDDGLSYIINQTPELCEFAVGLSRKNMALVRDQNEDLCINIVSRYPDSLLYVRDQTYNICIAALKVDHKSFRFIRVQTEEICRFAADHNMPVSVYIKNKDYLRFFC